MLESENTVTSSLTPFTFARVIFSARATRSPLPQMQKVEVAEEVLGNNLEEKGKPA